VTPALELRGIGKRFGALRALDGVDFTLVPGEIHALLGENGAGKSTLMNIVRGLLAPTAGSIAVGGHPVSFASPRDAARAGIGMVHQHFLLVPPFTVLENLALVAQDQGLLIDHKQITRKAEETARRLGWCIPLDARIADLPVGTQQRVEILKALLGDARILLFDEPTAVLAPGEIGELFGVLRALRAEGRSLVFVSHKLGEVMALCDRVTVLRRGRVVGTIDVRETSPEDLARRMVGGDGPQPASLGGTPLALNGQAQRSEPPSGLQDNPPSREAGSVHLAWGFQPQGHSDQHSRAGDSPPELGAGEATLTVSHLTTAPQPDAVALRDISFMLTPGEILGFAGVDGNGQAELAQALTGLRPWAGGTITLNGQAISRLRPPDLARLGIALIPPDRHRDGLALPFSVAENLMLEAAALPQFRRGPFLNRPALRRFAAQIAREFDVRADSLDAPAAALSGGNQQKIVIARALWRKPPLLIAVSPTRGLDVAATAYVHARLRQRRAEGGSLVLISTELDEVIALSTRIAVLYEGRIVGIVPSDTPRETLGLMMGGKAAPAHA